MSTIQLEQYPIIDGLDRPEAYLIEQVKKYLIQFGFFYIRDTIEARKTIDRELEAIQNSVDVYYGEDAYTGKGSVFHGTYSRFESEDKTKVGRYIKFIDKLLSIISCACGYPPEFLHNFSQERSYGLYFYDREEEYIKYIKNIDRKEIAVEPHRDRSLITLVVSIRGLEGYTNEYNWFSMPDREGYLIVQGGTTLQEITQSVMKANIHRVRGNDSSKALFWSHLVPVN